jgi:cell wall-associated NlpC family hydrolase
VFWDNSSRNNGADHVAIYLGHGRIIEAPRPGLSVQVSEMYDSSSAWGVRMKVGGI